MERCGIRGDGGGERDDECGRRGKEGGGQGRGMRDETIDRREERGEGRGNV